MRPFVTASVLILGVGLLACDADSTLTGTEAEEAFADATARFEAAPGGVVVFVDGERIPSSQAPGLRAIDPEQIGRIEVLKGAAATRVFGAQASRGVIRVYTKRFADSVATDSLGRVNP